ncbi:hypothetical protein GCM10027033_15210 [Leucobacter ruminantium]
MKNFRVDSTAARKSSAEPMSLTATCLLSVVAFVMKLVSRMDRIFRRMRAENRPLPGGGKHETHPHADIVGSPQK